MTPKKIHAICNTLEEALTASWPGEANLIGTLVDRHIVKIAGAGEYSEDAILVFLEAIRNASNTSSVFGKLWKTIRDDKTVDLWLYDHEEKWRSVSFEVQFQQTFPTEDLYMVVSTFVPFGVGGDRSHYPVEQSTAYIRGTQELRAVISMQARRMFRGSSQELNESQDSSSYTNTRETEHRNSEGYTTTSSQRTSHTNNQSRENVEIQNHVNKYSSKPQFENATNWRTSQGTEYVRENRHDLTWSGTTERTQMQRDQSDSLTRSSSTHSEEDLVELTEDVSFMAVGPDFTQPERLIAAWRACPGNKESSLTIDMMLCALPSLSRIIEQGVSHRRMAARARRRNGEELDFWKESDELIARYNPSVYGQQVVLTHDGYPRAIEPTDIARAIRQARGGLGQLTGRSHFLPGESSGEGEIVVYRG